METDGAIIKVNAAAVKYLGEDLIGRLILMVIKHFNINSLFLRAVDGDTDPGLLCEPTEIVKREFTS